MALFVAEHQHSADHCPAAQPAAAMFLQKHLTQPEAAKFEVRIRAEAVARGEHHLYLIVDAPNAAAVERYLAPFAQAGSVEVRPASTCEEVVARGAC